MSEVPQEIDPQKVGTTSQIIATALIGGVVVFAGVAYFAGNDKTVDFPLISVAGAGFAATAFVLRFVIPTIIVGNQTKSFTGKDPQIDRKLAGLYQTKTIIGMALIEGAAFMNCTAYIIEKQIWTYGVIGFLLAIMIFTFPSQGQFESWAEQTKRDLA